MHLHAAVLLIAVATSPATAADPARPTATDQVRLSESEVRKVLDAAAQRPTVLLPDPGIDEEPLPGDRIEGELGFSIGTGGYREAFGTAVVPLGPSGSAIISFDTVQSNRDYRRRR